MIELPLLDQSVRTRSGKDGLQVFDPIRKAWLSMTPEEHVRQLLLTYLREKMNYPSSLMAVERGVSFGHITLRYDLVIYHRDSQQPWMLAECKAPEVPIAPDTLQQLLQYHSKLPGCRYWLLTNGHQTFCADATNPQQISWLKALPAY
jgi:hypothetical protein